MAVYSTFVLRSKTEADARRVFGVIQRRWPMMAEERRTVLSAWADGDLQSVMDVAEMVLNSRGLLGLGEREELLCAVLECRSWPSCLAVLAEWELAVEHGALVDLRNDDEPTPATDASPSASLAPASVEASSSALTTDRADMGLEP